MRTGSKQPFSFHCTICYEIFDPAKRPPVVLPCGHTYLCSDCSCRLDKCMECRTPLSIKVASQEAAAQQQQQQQQQPVDDFSWGAIRAARQRKQRQQRMNRYGVAASPRADGMETSQSSSPTAHPAASASAAGQSSINLPTPKNLVLLTLMESAQAKLKQAEQKELQSGYESGNDDDMVDHSIRLASNTSGTYVVKRHEGLLVYDIPEAKRAGSRARASEAAAVATTKPIYNLSYSQNVQISYMTKNFAYVAYQGGYIPLESKEDLIKVGPPTEHVTSMEGAREDIKKQMEDLQQKMRLLHMRDQVLAESIMEVADQHIDNETLMNPFGPEPDEVNMLQTADRVEGIKQERLQQEFEEKKIAEEELLRQQHQDRQRFCMPDDGRKPPATPQGYRSAPTTPASTRSNTSSPASIGAGPSAQAYGSLSFDDRAYHDVDNDSRDNDSARSLGDIEHAYLKPWHIANADEDNLQGTFFCAAADMLPTMFGGSKQSRDKKQEQQHTRAVRYPAVARELQHQHLPSHFADDRSIVSNTSHVDFRTGFSHHAGLNVAHRRKLGGSPWK